MPHPTPQKIKRNVGHKQTFGLVAHLVKRKLKNLMSYAGQHIIVAQEGFLGILY